METNDAFISYLRKKMISEEPSANELISMLDKRLFELNNHQDRVKLLSEIGILRKSPNIDRYYLGMIQDFFDYAKFKHESENDNSEIKKDWSGLFNDLIDKYIKDVSLYDFTEVINSRRLPKGKDKIVWIGRKAETVYFQQEYEWTMKQLNECFIHKNGTGFSEHNRLSTPPDQRFIDIITKHKPQ